MTQSVENDSVRCDGCGKAAARHGRAWPAGGSFPLTACASCVAALRQHMYVEIYGQGASM